MSKTKIEWADAVWNPVTGCTPISPGCENCYAKRMAQRLRGRCGYPADDPFRVTLHPERLEEPLRWKKPRRVFVCSMGDLFHEDVPDEFIYDIWDVMVLNRQHTFLLLTKRPTRMKKFIEKVMANRIDYAYTLGNTQEGKKLREWARTPVSNIWLGVTAENQEQADKRIPILLQIPAAVRFVSVEPMLGPVDLSKWLGGTWYCETCECTVDPEFVPFSEIHYPCENYLDFIPGIDWVICGGETGPGARPMHPDWARNLRKQCQKTGVPFFFKQWGEWCHPKQMQGEYDRPMPVHKFSKKTVERFLDDDPDTVIKCGKKKAGRLLDGREWNELPGS